MNEKYQTNEIDTSMLAVPGQVTVVMEEIAADMHEGLLATRSTPRTCAECTSHPAASQWTPRSR